MCDNTLEYLVATGVKIVDRKASPGARGQVLPFASLHLKIKLPQPQTTAMSRPLRLEFPGATYHVTSRGDRREPIYRDDADRAAQLQVIGAAMDRF